MVEEKAGCFVLLVKTLSSLANVEVISEYDLCLLEILMLCCERNIVRINKQSDLQYRNIGIVHVKH